MPRDPLDETILKILDEKGPLRFRQIEAHVVLKDLDVSTFEVQRAIKRLVDEEVVTQTDDFRLQTKGES